MTMALTQLTIGDARFRAGRWQGRAELATLVPLSAAQTLDQQSLSAARRILRDRGFQAVVTAALAPPERAAFELDDFSEREHLHLLRYDLGPGSAAPSGALSGTPSAALSGALSAALSAVARASARTGGRPRVQRLRPRPRRRPRTRRGTSRDFHDILTLDAQSFDEFWHFDRDGLEDSITATPSSRLRVVRRLDLADTEPPGSSDRGNEIVGYALAGRAGRTGFLQRLAVHPAVRRHGIGTLLVDDALAWARRRGAKLVWVNTQKHNDNALRLYQKLGFTLEEHPLTVMYRTLT